MDEEQILEFVKNVKRIADALERIADATEFSASPAVILPRADGQIGDTLMKEAQAPFLPKGRASKRPKGWRPGQESKDEGSS